MLVFGLVELAAEKPNRLKTATDIYWALRSRMVILPQAVFDFFRTLRPRSLLARKPGFSDLYIVRDEWVRYEAGEIAHVENVMASETRERSHTRITENEEIISTEEERNKFDEHDTQTTDRFDLHDETTRDSSLNMSAEGNVDTSGQYGVTKVSTHLGGSLDYSLDESQSQATTTAHETVARAVVRVEEKVRQVRTTRSLSRIEEINKHSFKNDGAKSKHITGIYRWVDKIKRVQIFRYPNRFLLEFQVPEPGAWLRWLLDPRRIPLIAENPEELKINIDDSSGTKRVDLLPLHLNENNYLQIAARYKTLGIEPPPTRILINTRFNQPTLNPRDTEQIHKNDPIRFMELGNITIIDGFVAKKWYAKIHGWGEWEYNRSETVKPSVLLIVGNSEIYYEGNDVKYGFDYTSGMPEVKEVDGDISWGLNTNPGIMQTGLPVSIRLDNVRGFNIHITVECEPSEMVLMKWRISTYEKIAAAYYAMKRQYNEELAAQSLRSGVQIEGQSPVQNTEMARTELKKAVIELLTASDLTGRNAFESDPNDTTKRLLPPEIDLLKSVEIAPEIQFLEQIFEWENMSYVLYPYFWADKKQWTELADLSGPDPDFARFLRAGSARVVLPARPNFELQAILYVYFGLIWGGGSPPGPEEDDYLSIAEEIRAQEMPPRDGEPGESWEVRLPTTLVWLDDTNAGLPIVNSNSQFDAPPGQKLP
jgi:hypothetical protein